MPLRSDTPRGVPVEPAPLDGPPALPVPACRQIGDNWCWAACAQMVLAYYGQQPQVRQCALANKLLGRTNCCKTPWPLKDCDKLCSLADVTRIYGWYGRSATRLHSRPDHALVVQEITAGRPVQVALQPTPGLGHVVLIRWAGTVGGTPSMIVNNPTNADQSVLDFAEKLDYWHAFDAWTGIT